MSSPEPTTSPRRAPPSGAEPNEVAQQSQLAREERVGSTARIAELERRQAEIDRQLLPALELIRRGIIQAPTHAEVLARSGVTEGEWRQAQFLLSAMDDQRQLAEEVCCAERDAERLLERQQATAAGRAKGADAPIRLFTMLRSARSRWTDVRNYHRHLLHAHTGLVAEDRQAKLMVGEVQELRATLERTENRSVPLSVAAYRWLSERYQPAARRLAPLVGARGNAAELYCQMLEHKWYLSEREKRDVGYERAVEDFVKRFRPEGGGGR